jgi:RNA polymerase sigma-70 factor (ECF subfamily)
MRRGSAASLLSLALLAGACGGATAVPTAPTAPLLTRRWDQFVIYYTAADSTCIPAIVERLESNHDRVCADLRYALDFTVVIRIYPDLASAHQALGSPAAADWVIGQTGASGEITMVSPLNPGPVHTYASVLTAVVHEFTHAVVIRGLRAPRLPVWLQEGTAAFETGPLSAAERAGIAPYVATDRVPSFSQLDAASFADLGGYAWSNTIVEFAVTAYGAPSLRVWIDRGGDFESTFGISEQAFRAGWLEYLKAHYS